MTTTPTNKEIKYGGFWIRFWASTVDTLLLLLIIAPISIQLYGLEYFTGDTVTTLNMLLSNIAINWIFPFIAVVVFWRCKGATPGKMLFKLVILDAKTLKPPTNMQLVIRYLGYFVSSFIFCLGFLWIAFDKRKQGWHDKLAKTVVVKKQCLKL